MHIEYVLGTFVSWYAATEDRPSYVVMQEPFGQARFIEDVSEETYWQFIEKMCAEKEDVAY